MTTSTTTSVAPARAEPVPPRTGQAVGVAFHDVGKRFGALWALRRISLRIEPGEFVLLRGPNGSGKSTLLKIAATLARPSAGRVEYPGVESSDGIAVKARIGMVAHSTLLYDDLTAEENLRFFGDLFGLANRNGRVEGALASVGLADRRDSMVRTFSRGMRQRLSLARAMLHSPGLLLLDEPATGLDQEARDWLDRTLAGLHASGCTVVMSTHAGEGTVDATRSIRLNGGVVVSDAGETAAARGREGGLR